MTNKNSTSRTCTHSYINLIFPPFSVVIAKGEEREIVKKCYVTVHPWILIRSILNAALQRTRRFFFYFS